MNSSPEDNDDLFPEADAPSTPKHSQAPSELSPPTSHGPHASGSNSAQPSELSVATSMERSTLNENGKRVAARSADLGNGIAKSGQIQQQHKPTGYTWDREEDAPGYSWKNKKAQEDYARSWDNIVGKDQMIGSMSFQTYLLCCRHSS